MADYPDQPDYQQAVTPGVTRWAPGTEFGNISWSGSVAANADQVVDYQIPNNGFLYVVDKVFIYSQCIGIIPVGLSFCNDYGSPSWINLSLGESETCLEFSPFTFQSMALGYPMGIRWNLHNPNNVARILYVNATMYRYLSSA